MTPAQLARFTEQLRALTGELRHGIGASAERAAPVDLEDPIGRLSRMDAMQQQKMAEAQVRLMKVRLELAQEALARVDAGTYGACLDCGDDVDPRRLQVRPETPWCLACQAERET